MKVTPFMRWLESGILFDFDRIDQGRVDWWHFYSCNVSVKRTMLERVDGFDDARFPFRYEDLDLGRRMSDRGFQLLYNAAALGDHLKTETLETWRGKLHQVAIAERRFHEIYPDFSPYFYERFSSAAEAPRARGRSAQLVRLIPSCIPVLGPIVWRSYDVQCTQALAPDFLASWEAADPMAAGEPATGGERSNG